MTTASSAACRSLPATTYVRRISRWLRRSHSCAGRWRRSVGDEAGIGRFGRTIAWEAHRNAWRSDTFLASTRCEVPDPTRRVRASIWQLMSVNVRPLGAKMSEQNLTIEPMKTGDELKNDKSNAAGKPAWETPKLEDVSEQVMAQPYIRFT